MDTEVIPQKAVSFLDSTSFPDLFQNNQEAPFRCLDITPIDLEKTRPNLLNFTQMNDVLSSNKIASKEKFSKKNVNNASSINNMSDTSIDVLAARVQLLLGKSVDPAVESSCQPTTNIKLSIQDVLREFDDENYLQNKNDFSNNKIDSLSHNPTFQSKNLSNTKSQVSSDLLKINDNIMENNDFLELVPSRQKANDSSSIIYEVNRVLEKLRIIKERFQNKKETEFVPSVTLTSNSDFHQKKNSNSTLEDIEYLSDISEPTEYYPIAKNARETLTGSIVNKIVDSLNHVSSNNLKESHTSKKEHGSSSSLLNENNIPDNEKVLLLIERQRNYLKTIQEELTRLEKAYQHIGFQKKNKSSKFGDEVYKDKVNSKCQKYNEKLKIYPNSKYRTSSSQFASCTDCCLCDYHSNNVMREHQQIAFRINQLKCNPNLLKRAFQKHSHCHCCTKMDAIDNVEHISNCFDKIHLNSTNEKNASDSSSVDQHGQSRSSSNKNINKSVQTSILIENSINESQPKQTLSEIKKPTSWFFDLSQQNTNKTSNSFKSFNSKGKLSTPNLQDAFDRNCNKIKLRSSMRIRRIKDNIELRVKTAEQRREEITQTYLMKEKLENEQKCKCANKSPKQAKRTSSSKDNNIPRPLSFTTRNVFTHREMRAQTEKVYSKLPEVKAQKVNVKREDDAKRRRMMANIFKQRLKENAIRGKLNWPITSQAITA